jgi:hypothetical protein
MCKLGDGKEQAAPVTRLYKEDTLRKIVVVLWLSLFLFGCSKPSGRQIHDGDIIFQTSRSSQSAAIQIATHSKYSHMGRIFLKDGKPYVFEAVRNVQYTPLKQWISRGVRKHYVIKRLRNADKILTTRAIANLKSIAAKLRGKPYDPAFEWSDDRIYCSELVWKIFDRGIGIQVGRRKKLLDFDLSSDAVKRKIKERYGDRIPLEESVISPGDMFSSELLKTVSEK